MAVALRPSGQKICNLMKLWPCNSSLFPFHFCAHLPFPFALTQVGHRERMIQKSKTNCEFVGGPGQRTEVHHQLVKLCARFDWTEGLTSHPWVTLERHGHKGKLRNNEITHPECSSTLKKHIILNFSLWLHIEKTKETNTVTDAL